MDPFIGQIIMFAGNFAPRGWAFCEGQLLAINANQALFSILGTTYGGDGRTSFALPDLRGRMPTQQGNGPGLPTYKLGQKGGNPETTLMASNLPPAHVTLPASDDDATTAEPGGGVPAINSSDLKLYSASGTSSMKTGTIQGANLPFSNMPPYLGMNYIIALVGTFPSRS